MLCYSRHHRDVQSFDLSLFVPIMKCSIFPSVLLLVGKNVSVTSLAGLHVDNGLVGVLHAPDLDPGLDLLVGGKLEHLLDLVRSTNGTATNLDTAHDEGEGVDRGKVAAVRGTNLDEGTLDLQEGEVAVKRHLLAGDSADDQVKSAGVVLGPVLVVIGGNVAVSSELENLLFLGSLAGDTNNLVSSESLGEEHTEVTQTTDTDDTDL